MTKLESLKIIYQHEGSCTTHYVQCWECYFHITEYNDCMIYNSDKRVEYIKKYLKLKLLNKLF